MKVLYGITPLTDLSSVLVGMAGNSDIMPGDKVYVSNSLKYKNDVETPWHTLLEPGVVIRRYGTLAYKNSSFDDDGSFFGPYPDSVDVLMDEEIYRGERILRGHFTEGVVKACNLDKVLCNIAEGRFYNDGILEAKCQD